MGDCVLASVFFLRRRIFIFCAIHAKNVRVLESHFFMLYASPLFFSSSFTCFLFVADAVKMLSFRVTLGIILTFLYNRRAKKVESHFPDSLINWAKRHKLFIKMYSTKLTLFSLTVATLYFFRRLFFFLLRMATSMRFA